MAVSFPPPPPLSLYVKSVCAASKWLPSANQRESCCGKSVREIIKRGVKAEVKEALNEVWIAKHGTVWCSLTWTSSPHCALIHFFPVYFHLFVSLLSLLQQSSPAASLNANGRYGNKTLTLAESQWIWEPMVGVWVCVCVYLCLNTFINMCHLLLRDFGVAFVKCTTPEV